MRLSAPHLWSLRHPYNAAPLLTHLCLPTQQRDLKSHAVVSTSNTRGYATEGTARPGNHIGIPSASAADVSSPPKAVTSKVKSSRFVRSIANVDDAAEHGGYSDSGVAPQGCGKVSWAALQVRLSAPSDLFSAAAVTTYLQRLYSLLRHEHHVYTRASAVQELGKIVLPSVKGIDSGTVLLLLQTLRMADASHDMPLVRDAVTWMSLHGLHLTIPQTTSAIDLLLHFDGTVAGEVAVAFSQRTPQSTLLSLPTARVVSVLTAILPTVTYGERISLSSKTITQLERTSQHSILSAEGLRDACISGDVTSLSPASLAQLLRGLWAFERANQDFYRTEEAAEWRSVEESVCNTLAMSDKCAQLPFAEVVSLMSDLVTRQHQARASDAVEMGRSDARLEQLSVALRLRLSTLTERLRSFSPQTGVVSSILPEPWSMRDITSLWSHGLARTDSCHIKVSAPSLGHGRDSGETGSAYANALENLKEAVVSVVNTRCKTESHSLAVLQMAAHLGSELVVSWMATAQHTRDEANPQEGVEDLSTLLPDLTSILPESMLQGLLDGVSAQLRDDRITWTSQMVREAVSTLGNSRDPQHRSEALAFAKKWYRQLHARAQDGERLQPIELLAFFMPDLLREEKKGVSEAVNASLSRWSVSEVLYFFSEIAISGHRAGGAEGVTVLRESGKLLCPYVAKASAAQLVGLVDCYGAAQVRSDEFCEAVAVRLSELLRTTLADASRETTYSSIEHPHSGKDTQAKSPIAAAKQKVSTDTAAVTRGTTNEAFPAPQVTLPQLARLLRSLALMETRQAAPFVDAAHTITCAADADHGTAEHITHLIAAYAKMLIWSYPVLRALSERLLRIGRSEVTLSHLVTAQLALLRMDLHLPPVTSRLYEHLCQVYNPASAQSHLSAPCSVMVHEMVVQLSIVARLRGHTTEAPLDEGVLRVLIDSVVASAGRLRMEEIAEVLLSLGRLGQGDSAAFQSLTVRTLGMLPRVPPRVMAHVVEAYALAGRGGDTELFTLVADRTIAMRHEMASVTIASILASFAKAGARNDRLFIEAIPRVRHVATYGTPRDVVNVVSAYATVNLWHYKLFARLAERAIQLRADFRTPEMVALLKSYAKVQMRYDRLFTEFAPRVQTLIHLLTPSELASVACSYAQLDIRCPPVWKATAAQAAAIAERFTLEDARSLLDAYAVQSFFNEECVHALTTRFPELASTCWKPTSATDQESHSGSSDFEKTEGETRDAVEKSQCLRGSGAENRSRDDELVEEGV